MSENKNHFSNLVDSGAIKVKQRTPEWAKKVLLEEVQYITKLQKLDSLMLALVDIFQRNLKEGI